MLDQKTMADRYAKRLEQEKVRGKKRRAEKKAAGLVPVTVWVPVDAKETIKALVTLIEANKECAVGFKGQDNKWKIGYQWPKMPMSGE
jgi:hypothetical protein